MLGSTQPVPFWIAVSDAQKTEIRLYPKMEYGLGSR